MILIRCPASIHVDDLYLHPRHAPPVSVTPQAIQQPSCAIAVPAICSNAWHQGPNPLRILCDLSTWYTNYLIQQLSVGFPAMLNNSWFSLEKNRLSIDYP